MNLSGGFTFRPYLVNELVAACSFSDVLVTLADCLMDLDFGRSSKPWFWSSWYIPLCGCCLFATVLRSLNVTNLDNHARPTKHLSADEITLYASFCFLIIFVVLFNVFLPLFVFFPFLFGFYLPFSILFSAVCFLCRFYP